MYMSPLNDTASGTSWSAVYASWEVNDGASDVFLPRQNDQTIANNDRVIFHRIRERVAHNDYYSWFAFRPAEIIVESSVICGARAA
jgi:hypothetical protein